MAGIDLVESLPRLFNGNIDKKAPACAVLEGAGAAGVVGFCLLSR